MEILLSLGSKWGGGQEPEKKTRLHFGSNMKGKLNNLQEKPATRILCTIYLEYTEHVIHMDRIASKDKVNKNGDPLG